MIETWVGGFCCQGGRVKRVRRVQPNFPEIALATFRPQQGFLRHVGGFLGMGDHYVVVRPSAISFNAKDDKWHAIMNANADQLKAAPEYKYSSKS